MWDQLVDCICRPPRDTYEESDLIGGQGKHFRIGRCKGKREDSVVVNSKGQTIRCSHFKPADNMSKDGRLPCVVYCHCNSGSMRDAEEAVYLLLPLGVSVFAFDFTGSGRSDGEWVTLGSNEADDLEVVIRHLRVSGTVSTIGLWGRSMGAVTALLYSQRDPSIAGMVLDSPFSRLTDLMLEIVEEQKLPIPKAVSKMAVSAMRRSVKKRAQFDINSVSPIESVTEAFIPALFGHGEQDTFIQIHHSERLHAAYAGDKNMVRFEGDHNSRRPEFFYSSVSIFLHNVLQLHMLLKDERQDAATLRANSNESYQLHQRTMLTSASRANSTGVPWVYNPEMTDALHLLSQEQSPDGDEDDLLLQQVLELSLRDAQAAEAGGGSGPTPVDSKAAGEQRKQASPPADDEDDEDAMLRAAIEASLRESSPSSTPVKDSVVVTGNGVTPAVVPPATPAAASDNNSDTASHVGMQPPGAKVVVD